MSYLQIRHFITLFELFKQPPCPEGQIEKNHQCSNLNSSPGGEYYRMLWETLRSFSDSLSYRFFLHIGSGFDTHSCDGLFSGQVYSTQMENQGVRIRSILIAGL